jgi:hypothetical protein
VSQTYSNVDESADPAGAVGWQERMAEWPAVVAYKRRTHALFGDAKPVLDVGSGPGHDLVALGVERSIGVDVSQAMCCRATERGAVAVRSDAAVCRFRTPRSEAVVLTAPSSTSRHQARRCRSCCASCEQALPW